MSTEVTLPALGESVTEGTVTQWLKSVGDEVGVDEALLEVSTDKVDTEIPSPVAGTLLEIRAAEDETVEVGAVLAIIGDAGESDGDEAKSASPDVETSTDEAGASDGPPQAEEQPADAGDSSEEQPTTDAGGEEPPDESKKSPESEGSDSGAASGSGDTTDVTLPALGESVTEGTVTQWLKSVGDDVEADEALLEVSTDKVDTEIPSPVAGTLVEIVVSEDETVEVGAVLARIGAKGSAPKGDAEPSGKTDDKQQPAEKQEEKQPEEKRPEEKQPEPEPESKREEPAEPADEGPSYVTPLVRKLASKHGVDLSSLSGTGVGGRIRKQDVLAAAEAATRKEQPSEPAASSEPAAATGAPAPSPLRGRTEKLSRLRKVIAARMVESLQTSAQLTTVVEVDVTLISRLRNKVKTGFEQREGVKLSFLPFFAKAAIDALKQYPQVNASIDTEAGTVTYHDAEHLGVAVDTERGLLVPVIHNAGDLSIAGLARKIADLAERTRNNQVKPDELSGGTFTLTNTGSRGALFDTPIINQPQVGILGTGTVVKRPVVIDDPNLGETIAVRQMAYLALTYDHRLVDGADAARFLTTVKQRLEEAKFESELGG
jgi:2-oxoglutarate dehydrogenase E2 component (dihydrolipoamide succinyltransferase)